jgi:ABC-type dipeptide/oligopeptide/nickel transport system ATPase component
MIEKADCILVMGRRGCGKSYLAKRIQQVFPRRVIIDTLNEYKNEGEIVRSFAEFSKKLIEYKENKSSAFVLIFQFPIESELNEVEFNEIMRICFYFGNIQIVIEEIQLHCKTQWLPHWLRNNLLVGRHQGISLLFTSQRPGEVNKTIVSQCAHIFCGNLIDGNDLKYVSNFLNQNSEKLVNLPDRRFLYFHKGKIAEISNDF